MNTSPYPIEAAMSKAVEHPDHYTWHPVAECKDITQEFNYNVGTAIAYLWRCGRKGDSHIEDLEKAAKHIQFECDRLRESAQA